MVKNCSGQFKGTEDQEPWNNISDFPSEPIENFSNWIDEDYFYADGIDNEEPFIDEDESGAYELGESYEDWNGDGEWTPGNWDGTTDGLYAGIDENIDYEYDIRYDGADNNGNGIIDETDERRNSPSTPYGNWGSAIENGILIPNGRIQGEYINGVLNPTYNAADFALGYWDGIDPHIRADVRYDEDLFYLDFDVFIYDFGNDGLPGEIWNDLAGDDGDAIDSDGDGFCDGQELQWAIQRD
jgi:hypothetical protein